MTRAVAAVVLALAIVAAPGLRFGAATAALFGAALMLSGLALAWTLLRHTQVSFWVRRRLAHPSN